LGLTTITFKSLADRRRRRRRRRRGGGQRQQFPKFRWPRTPDSTMALKQITSAITVLL
jgi:hypothetical protein